MRHGSDCCPGATILLWALLVMWGLWLTLVVCVKCQWCAVSDVLSVSPGWVISRDFKRRKPAARMESVHRKILGRRKQLWFSIYKSPGWGARLLCRFPRKVNREWCLIYHRGRLQNLKPPISLFERKEERRREREGGLSHQPCQWYSWKENPGKNTTLCLRIVTQKRIIPA